VHPYLHPNFGLVQLGICKPNGDVMVYRPLMDHCVMGQAVTLGPENPSLEDVIYCGYGKDGFYFDRTGFYQVRAIYNAPDGSRVMSNILHVRVRHPVSVEDEDVADLFFGQDQGTLLYLQGSDSKFLKHGNECFDKVLKQHADHQLAAYVYLIKGLNAGRVFKSIDTMERKMFVRKPQPEESVKLLSRVSEVAERVGLDAITIDTVNQSIADAHLRTGNKAAAEETQKRVKVHARKPLAGARLA
jgi:hypothetical protein